MPRYMMFIRHDEAYRNQPIPQALHEAMSEFVTANLKSGVLIDTAGLQPTSRTTTVRLARRALSVTDGPFAEAKEVIGGYALIEASSRKEAIELATAFMEIHARNWPQFEGACEVRPLDGAESASTASGTAAEGAWAAFTRAFKRVVGKSAGPVQRTLTPG